MAPTRLYLLKDGKQDIYVDINQLPQHQIDGVRFLYRQYKKKKPGVILNDPTGYGKCLQAVLFVNAIIPTLVKPIFVMCDEYDIENWVEHFQKWTDFNDIAVKSTNPFSKHMVFINTVQDAGAFARRHYSVLIVQNSSFTKEALHTGLKADFKIWMTSIDMKEHLPTFSMIHQWLDINNKVNLDDFRAKKNDVKDAITKSLLLDAFLEDVVIRRTNFPTPFKGENHSLREHKQMEIKESPRKVSRKNKDPTGSKVKRSKKRIMDDEDIDVPVLNKENVTIANEITFTNRDDDDDEIQESVRKILTKNKDPTGTKVKRSWNRIIDDDEDIDEPVINKDITNANKVTFTNHYRDDSNDFLVGIIDVNKNINNEMDVENFIRDQKPMSSNGFTDIIRNTNSIEETVQSRNEIPRANQSNTMCNFQNAINEIIDNKSSAIEEGPLQFVTDAAIDNIITTDFEIDQSDNSQGSFSIMCAETTCVNKEITIQDAENKEVTKAELSEEFDSRNDIDICNNKNSSGFEDKDFKESKQQSVESADNNNKNASDGEAHSELDFEDKLALLEEQVLKKFKGSVLDRLF